jgi:hypothetical protein
VDPLWYGQRFFVGLRSVVRTGAVATDLTSAYGYVRAMAATRVDPSGLEDPIVKGLGKPPGTWTCEELRSLGAAGVTNCDYRSGKTYSLLCDFEPCTQACTLRHEHVHRVQQDECCRRTGVCRKSIWGGDACNLVYQAWLNANKSYFECEAYSASLACLNLSWVRNGCNSFEYPFKPPASPCCYRLFWAKATHQEGLADNCRAMRPPGRCPISSDGSIIGFD